MKVLILGSGGREHALAWKISRSAALTGLWVLPGSEGIAEYAESLQGDPESPGTVVESARRIGADLVVVGPEAPLAAGVVDALEANGIAAFGPRRDAARIESSKVYAKELMVEAGIPTAPFAVFSDAESALAHVAERTLPMVVKADGLAAGKGVTVARAREQAEDAVREAMIDGRFGEAGAQILVEDCLVGEELSLMAISDGEVVVPLQPARDYKALRDGDEGPNTGGMGCVSPVPGCGEDLVSRVCRDVLQPAVSAMARRGTPFRGLLYAGLMLTAEGPRVLEFNCRFGDPETQVVLPRMRSDLLPILAASAGMRDDLEDLGVKLEWSRDAAVCVVMASGGYPLSYETGFPIEGLDAVSPGGFVFHAGTARDDEGWITSGGRVLGVTGLGPSIEEARDTAYDAVGRIAFPGAHFRSDVAAF